MAPQTVTFDHDKEEALEILTHPSIYSTIKDDYSALREDFYIPEDMAVLVCYVDDQPASCLTLQQMNGITWDVHVQILPEYREMSLELGHKMLNWIWENTTAEKLVAFISFKYENVKRYAERMGFEVEGISKNSIRIEGELIDQWLMGISK